MRTHYIKFGIIYGIVVVIAQLNIFHVKKEEDLLPVFYKPSICFLCIKQTHNMEHHDLGTSRIQISDSVNPTFYVVVDK